MLFRFVLLTASILILSLPAFSQTGDMTNRDVSKIKVEELSDNQIRQIMQRAESSGMTEAQMKSALLARGMSPSELQKLEARMKQFQEGTDVNDYSNRTRENFSNASDNIFESITGRQRSSDTIFRKNRIFGAEIFNNENLSFEPALNLPTPPDYQIGPGDEIIIDIWGASQQNYQITVSPEGSIYIENLGPIQINGLTIKQATERIVSRLTNIYSGLTGPGRNTYAEITLGDARTITVHIMGDVNMPGTYTLSAFASVFNAMYASGGPSETGSFRSIELIRNNEKKATIDLYEFFMNGTLEGNQRLQDQDIIKVNPIKKRVDLTGEVKRSGLYEMKQEETLSRLLHYSGGYTDKAYKKLLTIHRKTDTERKILNVGKVEIDHFQLINGDSITIAPILKRYENKITLEGAVFRPGEYAMQEEMTLASLIEKADGLREDAFLSRALIYRTQEDFTLEVIPIDLKAVIDGSLSVPLKKDDMITISSIFDLQEEFYVEISGEVNEPGNYPFLENTTLEDLIFMAGGLKESASYSRVEVARRNASEDLENLGMISEIFYFDINENLEVINKEETFALDPFDHVFIRKSPGYEDPEIINISGEVLYPGNYSIADKEERISNIIMRAGGLTEDAYPKGAQLFRKVEGNQEEREKALASIMAESEDELLFDVEEEQGEQAIGIELGEILKSPGSKYDIFIQQGDRLEIPKEAQTVKLTGALLLPITVRYDKSFTFSRYVSMAGGFSTDALKRKSYVIYANGSVDRTNKIIFFNDYPKIEPGAEIVVPRKPERERMSAQEAVGLSSALTSMALIIVTIINTIGGG